MHIQVGHKKALDHALALNAEGVNFASALRNLQNWEFCKAEVSRSLSEAIGGKQQMTLDL